MEGMIKIMEKVSRARRAATDNTWKNSQFRRGENRGDVKEKDNKGP